MGWSDGYVTEIEYTQGYYRELSPAIIDLALLSRGLARRTGGELRYCELGFGQGMSLNIHAAAYDGTFWGTDFASGQTQNARAMAQEGGTGALFANDGFAEFAARDDLPDFDVIGLHGIYSWISDEARGAILDVIRSRLAPGGVVYVSYNCPPGWSPAAPLQHLLSLYGQANAGMGLQQRIEGAVAFAQQVADANSRYFAINPQLAERLKDLKTKDWRYVAHEYFNAHWHPLPFDAVAAQMGTVRCDFAASAQILDHMEGANMTPAGRQLLSGTVGTVMKETVRDYLVNQQFRRDIFIKGGRALGVAERAKLLAAIAVLPQTPPDKASLEITTALGKIGLTPNLYRPVLDTVWARLPEPVTIGELARDKALAGYTIDNLVEVVITLIGTGALVPAREPSAAERARCRSLNDAIRARSVSAKDHQFLASPVTGLGVPVGQVFQLFMAAIRTGRTDDAGIVAHVIDAIRPPDPFRPGPRDPAAEATLRDSLAKDLATYRTLQPVYAALEID